jgi:ferric-dicitrate binding protein FerR (iron transport regulator)
MLGSRLEYLFERYLNRQCNESEEAELMELLGLPENERMVKLVMDKLMDKNTDDLKIPEDTARAILQQIVAVNNRKVTRAKTVLFTAEVWRKVAVASIVIVVAAATMIYVGRDKKAPVETIVKERNDIRPGGDKGSLTLADGTVLSLNEMPDGVLRQQGNYMIRQKGGVLQCDINGGGAQIAGRSYNVLSTPRGGQFQLMLPDGSKVWLNAESSLKFPVAFDKNTREVELSGEAYFEVRSIRVHDSKAKKPFNVLVRLPSGKQARVEVLGTHFNVSAYNNESSVKTTLVEGAVNVSEEGRSVVLKPGQQARLSEDAPLAVDRHADVEGVVAWKNGLFNFDNADITNIMRQIGRWYNVDIVYAGKITPRHFVGKIRRSAELSEVLEILRLSDIDFRVDGKTIVVK